MHWKLDKSPDSAYNLDKADYPRLPLFDCTAPAAKMRYLNEVFPLVFDQLATWQSMPVPSLAVESEADLQALAVADYPAIPELQSGAAMPACPKISKTLVSYIAGLLVVTPYYKGNCDDRAKRTQDAYIAKCLTTLNTINNESYKGFLSCKLSVWYKNSPSLDTAAQSYDTDGDHD